MTDAEALVGGARRELPRYLVDAVEHVSRLTDLAALHDLVRRFGGRARVAADSTAGVSRRGLLVQLMDEMAARPAGLTPLVLHLEVREGNTPQVQRLKAAVAAWQVELFSTEEWDELFELLDAVQVPDLRRWYSEFLQGCGRPGAPAHCTEPWAVFLHAASMNARPGETLPCFQLLRQLALVADGDHAFALMDWADLHDPYRPEDGTVGVPPGADKAPAAQRTDLWSPTCYLIIRLRPLLDADQDSRALLSHWWCSHPGEQQHGRDRRIDLGHSERAVRELIEHAESEWAYKRTDLAVEFLLPRVLLDLSVERWRKTSFQGVGGVLGEEHHVVVRSLDRHDRRDLHGRWGSRWQAFTEGRAGRVHWYPEDGRAHLLSEPPPAVAVLSSAPGSVGGEQGAHGGSDELGEALRAGVPVVLWDRRGAQDPAFRAALRELLDRHDPRGLPGVVRALRIASNDRDSGAETVVGRHVALLWDDPDRMPVAPAGTAAVSPMVVEEGP